MKKFIDIIKENPDMSDDIVGYCVIQSTDGKIAKVWGDINSIYAAEAFAHQMNARNDGSTYALQRLYDSKTAGL